MAGKTDAVEFVEPSAVEGVDPSVGSVGQSMARRTAAMVKIRFMMAISSEAIV